MNPIIQELLEISSSQTLKATEEYARDNWIPTPLEHLESATRRKVLMVSKVADSYKARVQKGYQVIIEQLKNESEKQK